MRSRRLRSCARASVAAAAAVLVGCASDRMQAPSASELAPLQTWPIARADVAARCAWVADAIAWRAVWRECEPEGAPVPDVDFAAQVVLVVARPFARGDELRWASAHRDGERARVVLEVASAATAIDANGTMFALPRSASPHAIELRIGTVTHPLAALAAPPDARRAVLPPVLRACEFAALSHTGDDRVLVAETPDQWRELRAALGDAGRALPDDWLDFANARALAFVGAPMRVWPGFALHAASEEGVDVLTIERTAPSGKDPGERSTGIVLAVPLRPRDLSLVLRLVCGPAPVGERLLTTLPAVH